MEALKLSVLILHMLLGLLIIILTLLHSPKSDGISSVGAAAQSFGSARGAEKTLNVITYWIVGLFFVTGFVSGYFLK